MQNLAQGILKKVKDSPNEHHRDRLELLAIETLKRKDEKAIATLFKDPLFYENLLSPEDPGLWDIFFDHDPSPIDLKLLSWSLLHNINTKAPPKWLLEKREQILNEIWQDEEQENYSGRLVASVLVSQGEVSADSFLKASRIIFKRMQARTATIIVSFFKEKRQSLSQHPDFLKQAELELLNKLLETDIFFQLPNYCELLKTAIAFLLERPLNQKERKRLVEAADLLLDLSENNSSLLEEAAKLLAQKPFFLKDLKFYPTLLNLMSQKEGKELLDYAEKEKLFRSQEDRLNCYLEFTEAQLFRGETPSNLEQIVNSPCPSSCLKRRIELYKFIIEKIYQIDLVLPKDCYLLFNIFDQLETHFKPLIKRSRVEDDVASDYLKLLANMAKADHPNYHKKAVAQFCSFERKKHGQNELKLDCQNRLFYCALTHFLQNPDLLRQLMALPNPSLSMHFLSKNFLYLTSTLAEQKNSLHEEFPQQRELFRKTFQGCIKGGYFNNYPNLLISLDAQINLHLSGILPQSCT